MSEHFTLRLQAGTTERLQRRPSSSRAALLGTQLDVWEVIATVRDNDNDVQAAAEYLNLPVGLVEAAVSYYGEFRDEIDAEIALNEAESQRGLEAYRKGQLALGR
jgi:uncharacterized protein (DUF433 family)